MPLYNWGTPPPSSLVTLPTWPTPPAATVPVNVANISELSNAIGAGDRAITLTANIPNSLYIGSNDNSVDLNGFSIDGLYIEVGAVRNKIFNGVINGDYTIKGDDVLVDSVNAVEGPYGRSVSSVCNRYAVLNSTFRDTSGGSCFVFSGATDLIFANVDFGTRDGGGPALRLMGPIRVVVVDSRFSANGNAVVRIHQGNSPYADGAHNVWVARNQVEKGGAQAAGIQVDAWAGSTILPDPTLSRMLIEDNNLYNCAVAVNEAPSANTKYHDMQFLRNTSYLTGGPNPSGNGGDTSNGYVYPTSEPNANTVEATQPAPVFNGGYGGAPPVTTTPAPTTTPQPTTTPPPVTTPPPTTTANPCNCPPGPQGPQGIPGVDGSDGVQGIQGVQGVPGSDSTVPGPKGDQGDVGPVNPRFQSFEDWMRQWFDANP